MENILYKESNLGVLLILGHSFQTERSWSSHSDPKQCKTEEQMCLWGWRLNFIPQNLDAVGEAKFKKFH